ncbi:MAG: cell division protein ZapA [Bryobacterales bacterium]|nr:cell division protein ZapA [Bryobacteraceae bacterium]MDW8353912.1 cell division protein ZapA [Bryobacterales bacterium]
MEPEGPKGQLIRVTIFGQTYTLRSRSQPGEVEALARQVDALMDSIASGTGQTEVGRVAVLACLHLADRLRALESELAALKERVDSKSREFSSLLEDLAKQD